MAEADARSMLTIARRDLKAAWILQDASIDEASWGFQVQQVVETALKAWLFQLGDSPPFTHDLVVLFKRLLRAGADVAAHRDLAPFTDFALQFRYDVEPEPMGLDRTHWLRRAASHLSHGLSSASGGWSVDGMAAEHPGAGVTSACRSWSMVASPAWWPRASG